MGGPGWGGEHVLQGPGEREIQKVKPAAINQAKPQGDDKDKETSRSNTSSLGSFDNRGRDHVEAAHDNIITIAKRYDATTTCEIFGTPIFQSSFLREKKSFLLFSVSEASH